MGELDLGSGSKKQNHWRSRTAGWTGEEKDLVVCEDANPAVCKFHNVDERCASVCGVDGDPSIAGGLSHFDLILCGLRHCAQYYGKNGP